MGDYRLALSQGDTISLTDQNALDRLTKALPEQPSPEEVQAFEASKRALEEEFRIDAVRSREGSSCIVYDVSTLRESNVFGAIRTIKNRFVLKEFYPKGLADCLKRVDADDHRIIAHNGGGRCFSSRYPATLDEIQGWFDKRKETFRSDLDKLDIHKYVEPNYTSEGKLYQGNGTYYILTGYKEGDSLKADRSEIKSLNNVSRIMLSICKSVRLIHNHEDRLLNLDIKPANIFKFKGKDIISWFDLGSMQSLESIRNPNVDIDWSYSHDYAAPELLPDTRDQEVICEKTDIYSIGAVLFWLIFDRELEHSDLVHIACGEDVFKYGTVAVKHVYDDKKVILRDIFAHTLRENTEDRWNDDELIDALGKLKVKPWESAKNIAKNGLGYLKLNLFISKLNLALTLIILIAICAWIFWSENPLKITDGKLQAIQLRDTREHAYKILGVPLAAPSLYPKDHDIIKEDDLINLGDLYIPPNVYRKGHLKFRVESHLLDGCNVYLYYPENESLGRKDEIIGIVVEATKLGISLKIPELGKFAFGENTYASLSGPQTPKYDDANKTLSAKESGTAWELAQALGKEYQKRGFKPQLFSLNPSFARAGYLELFPPLTIASTNRPCVLVVGQAMGYRADVEDEFKERFIPIHMSDYDIDEDKLLRQSELYPQEEDPIEERDFFANVGDIYSGFGVIAESKYDGMYVVDRLDADEMQAYSEFRGTNKPDIIGMFDNTKLAAFVFCNRSF
jgi:serine/threonine protein kinase